MHHPLRTRRAARAVLAAAAAAAALLAGPLAPAAHAATYTTVYLSAFDSRLLYDINHARTARGVAALTVVAGTTDIARSWTCTMVKTQVLAHNPNLNTQLSTHGSSGWTAAGENVGDAWYSSSATADTLFNAYWNSSAHRANILDPSFRFLGIASSKSANGFVYNTLDFVNVYNNAYGGSRVAYC